MELPKKLKKEFEDAVSVRVAEFLRDVGDQRRLLNLLESVLYGAVKECLQSALGIQEAFGRVEFKKDSLLHAALKRRDPPLIEEIISKVVGEGVTLTKKELDYLRKDYREAFLCSAQYKLREYGKRAGEEWVEDHMTKLAQEQLQDFLLAGSKAEKGKGEDQEACDGTS